jgi:hypothetical protein
MNVERFKSKAKELKQTVSKELEEATLDAAGNATIIIIIIISNCFFIFLHEKVCDD